MKWTNASSLNEWQILEIIEHKEIFKRLLTIEINALRAWLANCKYKGKEAEIYISIEVLNSLANGLDTLHKNYTVEKSKAKP